MRKKFLRWLKAAALGAASVLTALTISTAEVSAEQAAAEQYRQMFRSGNFYVEYETYSYFKGVWGERFRQKHNKILAGKDGSRVLKTKLKDKLPNVLYQNGKYYIFTSEKIIRENPFSLHNPTVRTYLVLPEADLKSPNLNPAEGWTNVRNELALPDEIAVFFWDDSFRAESIKTSAPYFNESTTRTVDKKNYDCDRYIVDIKSLAGTTIAQEAYDMLYENGRLAIIQKYFLRNGEETMLNTMTIKAITSDVPADAFAIKKKVKVYSADKGTMSDLIRQPAFVEELGGTK